MGSRRRIERRLETAERRTRHERREEIAEQFRRLTVRELAVLAACYSSSGRSLSHEEEEVSAKFDSIVNEAEEVYGHAEFVRLTSEVIAANKPYVQRELKSMGVEPWASH